MMNPKPPRRGAVPLFSPHLPPASPDDFSLFYGDPPSPSDLVGLARYGSGRAAWYGEPGTMLRVEAGYTSPREDNIFDHGKLAAVASFVRSGGRIRSRAPYATVMQIDADLVRETQRAKASGRLWEYLIDRPFSTGVADLDDALADDGVVSPRQRARLAAAEARGSGDLGRLWVRVRDGNHRLFGSLLGGCASAWVEVMKSNRSDLPDGYLR